MKNETKPSQHTMQDMTTGPSQIQPVPRGRDQQNTDWTSMHQRTKTRAEQGESGARREQATRSQPRTQNNKAEPSNQGKQQQTTNTRPKETATAQPKRNKKEKDHSSPAKRGKPERAESSKPDNADTNTQRNKTDKKNHKSTGPKGRKLKTVGDRQWAALLPVVGLPRWLALFSFFGPGVWPGHAFLRCYRLVWELSVPCFLSSSRSPLYTAAPVVFQFLFSLSMREARNKLQTISRQIKSQTKTGKTATTHKSPGQICISPAGKIAKNTKKGPKPQLPFPNAFC